MQNAEFLSSLNLFTLIAVVALAIGLLLFFLRKRSNRHPMDTPAGRAAEQREREDALRRRQ